MFCRSHVGHQIKIYRHDGFLDFGSENPTDPSLEMTLYLVGFALIRLSTGNNSQSW